MKRLNAILVLIALFIIGCAPEQASAPAALVAKPTVSALLQLGVASSGDSLSDSTSSAGSALANSSPENSEAANADSESSGAMTNGASAAGPDASGAEMASTVGSEDTLAGNRGHDATEYNLHESAINNG